MNAAPTIVTASTPIRSLDAVSASDVGAVRGKAAHLGELLRQDPRDRRGSW